MRALPPAQLHAGFRTVSDVVTRSAYEFRGDSPAVTERERLPDRGHSLVVGHGRRTVAGYALQWPADRDIHGRDASRA
ncbi:hypothetical protein [Streptomyces sp. NPDC058466]|uniref:hypothetical protein n=1 Tax=Streptomyces sp. NPDC058466 TaxID=3346512 RepID=UPI00365D10B8